MDELKKLSEILTEDIYHYLKDDPSIPEQHNRRGFVRAVFAYVEGMTYEMKQTFVRADGSSGCLTQSELAMVKEESFDLNDKGEPVSRPLFIPIAKNVRFMFSLLTDKWKIPLELKIDGLGWQSFVASIQVRNRLMHPKTPADLQVSDLELEAVIIAHRWYESHLGLALLHDRKNTHQLLLEVAHSEHVPNEVREMIFESFQNNPKRIPEERASKMLAHYTSQLVGL